MRAEFAIDDNGCCWFTYASQITKRDNLVQSQQKSKFSKAINRVHQEKLRQ
jgi:hypothetical protein